MAAIHAMFVALAVVLAGSAALCDDPEGRAYCVAFAVVLSYGAGALGRD